MLARSASRVTMFNQSSVSKSVSRDEIGGILGISTSLEALTRVVAPSMGGFLLGYFGRWAPGVFTAILMAGAVSFAYQRIVIPTRLTHLKTEIEGSYA